MSSAHAFRVHDVFSGGRTRVNAALETSPSPGKKSDTTSGMDAPLATPTRSDSTRAPPRHLATSVREALRGQDESTIASSSHLHSIYGLWSTCVYDMEDTANALPLAPHLDGDIFGIGKRPVQREIESDGCVQLVFVEE